MSILDEIKASMAGRWNGMGQQYAGVDEGGGYVQPSVYNGGGWQIINGKLYDWNGNSPAEVRGAYPAASAAEMEEAQRPDPKGGSDFANIMTGLAFVGGGAALTGAFSGGLGSLEMPWGANAAGPSAGMEDYALRVAAEDLAGGSQYLAQTGQSYPQFLQTLTSAGVPAAQAAAAASAAGKGLGIKEALQYAGIAAPIVGALLGSGALKSAVNAQQGATDSAIGMINSGAGNATAGINAAQAAGVGQQNDALQAGLTQLQGQYGEGVGVQNRSLDATLGDLTRRYDQGVTEQRGALDRGMADLAPYREAGAGAINNLSDLMGTSGRTGNAGYGDLTKKFTLADFWDDPVTKASFQTGLDTGTKSLEDMARSNGSLNSGATLKALSRFGTDYTGGQAAGSQARFVGDQNNTYNRLTGISNIGQNAVNSGNTLGFNTASNIANQGNSMANAAGNFRAGTANNIANSGNLLATNSAQMRTNTANNIANSGNTAATNAANINIGANNSIAGLLSGMGNARGAASIASGNTLANAGSTIGNWFSSQDTLDKILKANEANTRTLATSGRYS